MGFIVFLAIAGGIGYFVYKKFFANKAQNENNFAQTGSSSPREQKIDTPEPALSNEQTGETAQDGINSSTDSWKIAELSFNKGSYVRAAQLFERALALTAKDGLCDEVLDVGYAYLGEIYANVNGGMYDIEKARYWYQKAASMGNDDAKQALKELK
jgi:TPR repeat protein